MAYVTNSDGGLLGVWERAIVFRKYARSLLLMNESQDLYRLIAFPTNASDSRACGQAYPRPKRTITRRQLVFPGPYYARPSRPGAARLPRLRQVCPPHARLWCLAVRPL